MSTLPIEYLLFTSSPCSVKQENTGVMPFVNDSWNLSLVLFTYSALFFLLVYGVSLNPAKMERFMGRWITPVLLLSVVILCTAAIMNFDTKQLAPSGGYDSGAFFKVSWKAITQWMPLPLLPLES